MILFIDFETRSKAELRKVGAYRYAADPSTEVISVAWAVETEPHRLRHDKEWLDIVCDMRHWGEPGEDLLMRNPGGLRIVAHNAEFERLIMRHLFKVQPPLRNWRCTAAQSARAGLPRRLADAAAALGLTPKDERGSRLISKLSKPRRPSKDNPDEYWEPETAPDDYEALFEYNAGDVITMRELFWALPQLDRTEQALWELTVEMNDRGMALDLDAVVAARAIAAAETERLENRFFEITGTKVRSPKAAKALGLKSLKKSAVRHALRQTLGPTVREALLIRKEVARASVRKLDAMLNRVSDDGRIRGMLVYAGAERTARWSGAGVQPQNFPRGLGEETETAFDALFAGALDVVYEDVLGTVSGMLKGMFVGPYLVGDYAQIEARFLAWLAGQEDLVQDFAAGTDIYCAMASDIYGRPVTKADYDDALKVSKRQLGKVAVLGCGYGLGGAKLQTQLDEVFDVAVGLDFAYRIVDAYRSRYPEIPSLWGRIERLWRHAVSNRRSAKMDRLKIRAGVDSSGGHDFAFLQLPSGRKMYYAKPTTSFERDGRAGLGYYGRNIYKGGQWEMISTYGGRLTENVVQAASRDVMADAMLRMRAAGIPLVLTVHDEIVAEGSPADLKDFEQYMRTAPEWAAGLPINVEAFATRRYRK